MAKLGTPTEHDEQRDLCRLLDARGIGHFSIPNEGHRPGRYGRRLVARGLQRGAPDLVLVDLAPDGRPIAIEMKRASGGRVSAEQHELHAAMRAAGWHVIVGRGCRDAVEQLQAIGVAMGILFAGRRSA